MADKLLKSIKFPTLPDRYVIGDTTLTEEGAAAEAKAVGEALTKKADTKGRYEDLIVGGAEQLMADGYESDTEPYLFRPTGGSTDVGNREYLDKIVGGTVGRNQLVNALESSNWSSESGVTASYSNGVATISSTTARNGIYSSVNFVSGHKYFITCDFKTSADFNMLFGVTSGASVYLNGVITGDSKWHTLAGIKNSGGVSSTYFIFGTSTYSNVEARNPMCIDLTAMFGSTIADYIYSLEQATEGAGVAWFRQYFPDDYYPYDPGTLRSVEGVSAHETVGFNQFDKSTAIDGKKMSAAAGVPVENNTWAMSDYIKVVPNMNYYTNADGTGQDYVVTLFDANKEYIGYRPITTGAFNTGDARYVVVSTIKARTSIDNLVVNLSDPTRNGEYEPYTKHTYPLDSSLTLRGVPKLDANNRLYYDGDEYLPDGMVERRYKELLIDKGKAWDKDGDANGYNRYYFEDDSIKRYLSYKDLIPNSKGYEVVTGYSFETANSDVAISLYNIGGVNVGQNWFYIGLKSSLGINTLDALKTWLDSNYFSVVLELATPTTETADGYEQYQMCDPSGTEKFVTDSIVPVGHETRYPHDLKKKIETAPDSPSADGTYLMKRSGGKNTYMALPSTPSANGAYVLTVTVSGGNASYSWTEKE